MADRLNDTGAIAHGKMQPGETMSVELRKIDNGFIRRESKYDEKGNYSSKEKYQPGKEDITGANKSNALKGAIDHLRKDPTAANK